MNILFLTLLSFDSLQERNIYTDLLREFVNHGHQVYAISPTEKRKGDKTHLKKEENAMILRLQIGNIQKTNVIEKGISTVTIESKIKKAVEKYFASTKFDLVLYSTPPITFVSAINYVKERDGARTYLLLKDIFPQNAVDIGVLSKTGIKGLLYRHFRRQEKKLYRVSDYIGCMSQANVDYLQKHNPELNPQIIEVCPNSIDIVDKSVDEATRTRIRNKYGIPVDKRIFVYGGNLGKPQGIPFLIACLKNCEDLREAFFLIIGDGTDYHMLEDYAEKSGQKNLKVMRHLPREEYDTLVGACDVGLIFLDYRFTIPNFPSRLLSYMQARLPVLAATDPNTDIGQIIEEGKFGWWCESNDPLKVRSIIQNILKCVELPGNEAYKTLEKCFTSAKSYQIIIKTVEDIN